MTIYIINYDEINHTNTLMAIHSAEALGVNKSLYSYIMEALGIDPKMPNFAIISLIKEHIKVLLQNGLIRRSELNKGVEYTITDSGALIVVNMQNTARALNS